MTVAPEQPRPPVSPGRSRRASRLLVLLVVAVLGAGLLPAGPAAAAASPGTAAAPAGRGSWKPYVQHGRTVPTYPYADAVHESVYVPAPFDSDGDGRRDTLAIDIVRPSTDAKTTVPVIVDASPYFACCGRGNEAETKTYDATGTIAKEPLFYDNYFVPRGYAVAGVDLVGTSRSTGCEDVGGRFEVLGAKTAIAWLTGRISGRDQAGKTVRATWSSGRVGMIGKSWDGSIANGVAATGVPGLVTVVPISAISSWYDYERFNGVVRSPEYPTFLAGLVSGRPAGTCDAAVARDQLAADDATGSFNAYWARRDYRLRASRVRASVFVVHGANDLNVTTNQFASWWAALRVPKKIWLTQDGHVDPFDARRGPWVETLHRWFDHELQGLDNGVLHEPRATVQNQDGSWRSQSRWPAAGTRPEAVRLARLGGGAQRTFTDDPTLTESAATASPDTVLPDRAVFSSGTLPRDVRIAGSAAVRLRVRVDAPNTELTAKLVDYGTQRRVDHLSDGEGVSTLTTQSCWGESTTVDDACYFDTAQDYVTSDTDVLARGWQDAAHHRCLCRLTPLDPGRWYSITVPIDATDVRVRAGHRLALVVTASDEENTSPTATGATLTIDPRRSTLLLPVTGYAPVPPGDVPAPPSSARSRATVPTGPAVDRRRSVPGS